MPLRTLEASPKHSSHHWLQLLNNIEGTLPEHILWQCKLGITKMKLTYLQVVLGQLDLPLKPSLCGNHGSSALYCVIRL